MDLIWISNKLFMISLLLLMGVFIWHGFGWKRLLVWRRMTERTQDPVDSNELRQLAEEEGKSMRRGDVTIGSVLRNPLLWVALGGIAVSIVITL